MVDAGAGAAGIEAPITLIPLAFDGRRRGFPRSEWPKDVQVSYAVWKRDGVEVEWEESYAEIVGDFYSAILPQLRLYGPPDDVRVVLSFD